MQYTTKIGDRSTQSHVNYQCPCGCTAGLMYDREQGSEHLGMCCCGRLLWVGADAEATVRASFAEGRTYQLEHGEVGLPWGESVPAVLAVPDDAMAKERAKLEAGRTLTKVVDPVCHMMIDPGDAAATSIYKGTTYYFCAAACKKRFDAEPGRYVQTKSLLDRILRR